jgi:hypothetical protein
MPDMNSKIHTVAILVVVKVLKVLLHVSVSMLIMSPNSTDALNVTLQFGRYIGCSKFMILRECGSSSDTQLSPHKLARPLCWYICVWS